jgi:N-carbamoyl-L-amino-acid hydrolase
LAEALAVCDDDGINVGEALVSIGYAGYDQAPWPPAACAEIRIKQGHVEDADRPIGLVTCSWAAYKYEIEVSGRQVHTGTTRMAERKDALLGRQARSLLPLVPGVRRPVGLPVQAGP